MVVYTPPGYEQERGRAFPVLYMQDGQNLFDPATAFCNQDWQLGQRLDGLIEEGRAEPLIVVGIYNARERRIHEYTHVRNRRGEGGGAPMYARFLVTELKPFIDSEYRTLRDAGNTGLGGSSLGGLVTLYMGLRFPTVFGRLAVMSPSVWWASKAILRRVRKPVGNQKIWLDVGTNEGSDPAGCLANARELKDVLVARGWTLGQHLQYVEEEGGTHCEHAWGARIRHALEFLFPACASGTRKQANPLE